MADTITYGLIGEHLSHSFSGKFFNEKFAKEKIDARYLNFEIADIGDLMEIFAEYYPIGGLNVTIPYKEAVIPYLDEIDPTASRIGAVNTIKVDYTDSEGNDFTLKGYNTDFIGFLDSIAPLIGDRKHALILGTGGASKAVAAALSELGVEWKKVSRTPASGQLSYSDISCEIMESHLIIVNTTPMGMYPHTDECPPIPYSLLTPKHLCYDLIYNPPLTLFLQKAHHQGAIIKNGSEMLTLQALAAWKIWNEE